MPPKSFTKMEGDVELAPTSLSLSGADRTATVPYATRLKEVVTTFWPLGLVAFGGPQAHVAILREHLVVNEKWLDVSAFICCLSGWRRRFSVLGIVSPSLLD